MAAPNLQASEMIARALLAIMDLPEAERRAEIEAGAALAYHDCGNFDRPGMTRTALDLARAMADQDAGDNFDLSRHYEGIERRGGDEGLTAAEAAGIAMDHFSRSSETQQAAEALARIISDLDQLPI